MTLFQVQVQILTYLDNPGPLASDWIGVSVTHFDQEIAGEISFWEAFWEKRAC